MDTTTKAHQDRGNETAASTSSSSATAAATAAPESGTTTQQQMEGGDSFSSSNEREGSNITGRKKVVRNTCMMPKHEDELKKYVKNMNKVIYVGRELNTFQIGPVDIRVSDDGDFPVTMSATNSSFIPGGHFAREEYRRHSPIWPFFNEGVVMLSKQISADKGYRPTCILLDIRTYLYAFHPDTHLEKILEIFAKNAIDEFNTHMSKKRMRRSNNVGKYIIGESELSQWKTMNRGYHFTKIEVEVVRQNVT